MYKINLQLLKELQFQLQTINNLENSENRAKEIKLAYETLAKIKFELFRGFDEIDETITAKISLNEVDAYIENGMVVLEFDEALPCQKVDDSFTNRCHWRKMMNGALKMLFDKYGDEVPYFERAVVCVEVHKTTDKWDISNRMLNLAVNMLKGNFMPDDNITKLSLFQKGIKSDKEKTKLYICDYNADLNQFK